MTVPEPIPTINDTLDVLTDLSQCSPRRAKDRRTIFEADADTCANWSMAVAVFTQLAAWLVAWVLKLLNAIDDTARMAVLILVAASVMLTVVAFLAPIVASAVTLFSWKKIALTNLQGDIRHEQSLVDALARHSKGALADARYWLELKIKRIEFRVSYIFGDKTAQLTLLATSYLFVKEFGGFEWLLKTITAGPLLSNASNTSVVLVAAGLLGLSIGAVLLKHQVTRYRYQVELIERALKFRD